MRNKIIEAAIDAVVNESEYSPDIVMFLTSFGLDGSDTSYIITQLCSLSIDELYSVTITISLSLYRYISFAYMPSVELPHLLFFNSFLLDSASLMQAVFSILPLSVCIILTTYPSPSSMG